MTPPMRPDPRVMKAIAAYKKQGLNRLSDLAGLSQGTGDAVQSFAMGAMEPLDVGKALKAARRGIEAWQDAPYIVDAEGVPKTYYHGSLAPFRKFDFSRLGDNTGASDARVGAHFAGDRSDAEFYADMAARKVRDDFSYDGPEPTGWVGEFLLKAKNPLVVDESYGLSPSTVRRLTDNKHLARAIAERRQHDAIVYPHGTNVDAGHTAIVFSSQQIEILERLAALGLGGQMVKDMLAKAKAAQPQQQPPTLPAVTVGR